MVHTAFHLGRLLLANRYDWVFNVGIGGSFDTELEIGQIVRVHSQVFGDLGAEDAHRFIPIAKMPFFDENQFPYRNGQLLNDAFPPQILVVLCCSGLQPQDALNFHGILLALPFPLLPFLFFF